MTRPKKTFRDRLLIGLTAAPPMALILFCVSATARWTSESQKIRPMMERWISSDLIEAPSAAGRDYDERTSSEHTKAYRELVAALDLLNSKYSLLFSLVEADQDWYKTLDQERPTDKYVQGYLKEAAPLLRELAELADGYQEIWVPHETGNPNNYNDSLAVGHDLSDLLQLEFRAATRMSETDRALDTLELCLKLGEFDRTWTEDGIIRLLVQSLGSGIWSEEDLNRIDQLLLNGPDLNQQWQRYLRGNVLGQVPWLLEGKVIRSWRPDPFPVTYAPSRRVEWMRSMEQYQDVSAIGTLRSVKKVMDLELESKVDSRSGIDTAIQLPSYGQFHDGGSSKMYMARRYVSIANQFRHARTAVGIAKYKLANEAYPTELTQLSAVGSNPADTVDPLGRAFHFESDENGCVLGNASTWFQPRHSSWLSFQTAEETLGSLLQDYEEVTFQP